MSTEIATTQSYALASQVVHADTESQVQVAHRFPRDMKRATEVIMHAVKSDRRIAERCYYSRPVRGPGGQQQLLTGASVYLLRLCATCWGNIRSASRVIGMDDAQIYAQAFAWDIEANNAVHTDHSKPIVGRNGRRYSEDMVANTGRAAASIALRRALEQVIPPHVWELASYAAMELVAGSAAEDMAGQSTGVLGWFSQRGIAEDVVLMYCGAGSRDELTGDHVSQLRGLAQAYQQGEIEDLRGAMTGESGTSVPANGTWRREKSDGGAPNLLPDPPQNGSTRPA